MRLGAGRNDRILPPNRKSLALDGSRSFHKRVPSTMCLSYLSAKLYLEIIFLEMICLWQQLKSEGSTAPSRNHA